MLVFCLLLSTACQSAPATTPSTAPATTQPATTDPALDPNDPLAKAQLGEKDLSDVTITISDGGGLTGDLEGSALEIANATMWLDLTDRFGCEFDLFQSDYQVYDLASSVMMGGDKFADLMFNKAWVMGFFIQGGFAEDLNQYDVLKTENSYWMQSAVENFNLKGRQYALSGAYTNSWNGAYGIFYNKALAEELQLPDLYQLVRDGEWTLAKMSEYAKKATRDITGDGQVTADDCWGIGFPGEDGAQAMFVGAGGLYFNRNEDGTYGLNMGTAETGNVLRDLADMVNNATYNLSEGHAWTYYLNTMFPEGRLLFMAYPPNAASGTSAFAEQEGDFGFLPLPKYSKDQESYHLFVDHHLNTVIIPMNADGDNAAFILEAVACYGESTIAPVLLEAYESYFRDEESLEMLKTYGIPGQTMHPMTTLLGVSYSGLYGASAVVVNETVMRGGDPVSLYEAYAEATQITLDEIFTALE